MSIQIKIVVTDGDETVCGGSVVNTGELVFDDAIAEIGRMERFYKRQDAGEFLLGDNEE